jgi:predicted HAD superfamily Cof-like phosphohydrolase
MDLANHHLARSMQSYDATHAERVNEYRRIAEERRAEEPRNVLTEEPRWYRAWFRLADALTAHRYHGHSHAH